ncbi:MAG: aspartate/tyrosine/aromatic aminotransferase, partial [Marinosulfonomonas sp.]|nr:aspartate/tyrosine/aromatic aminotransferase [Marinosulfonomonas sp.]
MLPNLKPQPADAILALMQVFRDDPRTDKIDLGVGVYKNAEGITPVMRAVKTAEKQLWEAETTKAYTGLIGDPAYGTALRDMILGDAVDTARVAFAATPGGTGAIRQAVDLIKMASPDATIWLSSPTWPNHPSIIRHMGMKMAQYRYFDAATRGVDIAGMLEDLSRAKSGDIILLHGCCHNPTGANPTLDQWKDIAENLEKTGAIPMIDLAYQGFGEGLEQDAAATRLIASRFPEVLIAASCSKNFGIYRERTGLLMAISPNSATQPVTQGTLAYLNRQNFSFPPDHGARLVTMILNDPTLKTDWQNELEDVRLSMLSIREQLAQELRQRTNSDRFDFLAQHRGMFSRLGA